jgi:hypothetical protein
LEVARGRCNGFSDLHQRMLKRFLLDLLSTGPLQRTRGSATHEHKTVRGVAYHVSRLLRQIPAPDIDPQTAELHLNQ